MPVKGGDSASAVRQVVRDLPRWGIKGDVTLRCDQERALREFALEVARKRHEGSPVRTFLEHSGAGESQSSGFIEAAVKSVEGLVRALKFSLEERIGVELDVHEPILEWFVEHSADLLTKFQRGPDGQTAWERLKAKPYKGEMYEFGCLVHHHVPGKTQGGELSHRWLEGVYLGTRVDSPEHIIAMEDGRVVKARDVQPLPEERQWNSERVLWPAVGANGHSTPRQT